MPIGNKNDAIAGLGSHHIALQSTDFQTSLDFYVDVLGMENVVTFDAGGRRIALLDIGDGSHMELFEPVPGSSPRGDATNDVLFHFALATTDIAAALERVRAAGMEITRELADVKLGSIDATIAFFKGPSGEVLEFFQVNN